VAISDETLAACIAAAGAAPFYGSACPNACTSIEWGGGMRYCALPENHPGDCLYRRLPDDSKYFEPPRPSRAEYSAGAPLPYRPPVNHVLKTVEDIWDAVERGEKTAEVRKNDRDFRVGDMLTLLRGTDPATAYRTLSRTISHIVLGPAFGIGDGYALLSFAKADDDLAKSAEPVCPTCRNRRVVDGHDPDEKCRCRMVEAPCPTCRPFDYCAVCGKTSFGGHDQQYGHKFEARKPDGILVQLTEHGAAVELHANHFDPLLQAVRFLKSNAIGGGEQIIPSVNHDVWREIEHRLERGWRAVGYLRRASEGKK
jgi:hypothetical protein